MDHYENIHRSYEVEDLRPVPLLVQTGHLTTTPGGVGAGILGTLCVALWWFINQEGSYAD